MNVLPGHGNTLSRHVDTHHTIIAPRRWQPFALLTLWRFRELAYLLCWRDIKVRYKQTLLGMLWAVIQPLLLMVVFTVFFGKLAGLQKHMESPYAIFVFAGQLPWLLFAQSLGRSSQSVIGSANLVTKVYFPRMLIPISASGACVIDFAIAAVILAVMMPYYAVAFTANILLLPVFVLMAFVCALGVGIFVSALNVAYRDFRYVVPFMINIWFFVTPVVLPVKVVPERWRWLLALNPMYGAVTGFRACILEEFHFDWGNIGIGAAVTVVTLFLGMAYFRRVERRFADII